MDVLTKLGPEPIATAGESSRVGLGELQEHAPGTARVRAVAVRAHETWLTLDYPGGREIVVALSGVSTCDQTPESHG